MCYFLTIASPLTLSEIRSMLPAGLTADPVATPERTSMLRLLPAARTVAYLLVGACSCDLVRPRLTSSLEDEREHRGRYQRSKLPRDQIIRELERHRRGLLPRAAPPQGWASALAAFVREHARNAGPTLYLLDFVPPDPKMSPARPDPVRCSADSLRSGTAGWLVEGQPVLVV